MTQRRFPAIDTLRAIAAIAVVTTHTMFWAGSYRETTLGQAWQRLEVGVPIFFALSGFLLALPWIDAVRHDGPRPSVLRYAEKRLLRIAPVYWVAVVVALVVVPSNHGLPWWRWLTSLSLVDLYVSPPLPNGLIQMWSLTVEVTFYLALPLVMALVLRAHGRSGWRPSRMLLVLGGLVIANLVYSGLTQGVIPSVDGWAKHYLISYLAWFALGIALAVLVVDADAPTMRLTRAYLLLRDSPGICWAIAGCSFFLVSSSLGGPPFLAFLTTSQVLSRTILYGVTALFLVLPCTATRPRGVFGFIMCAPPLRHLGHISYSIFCFHLIVLEVVADVFDFPLFDGRAFTLLALVLLGSWMVAELVYRFVERPALRLKAHVPSLRRAATTAPSASSTAS